MYNLFVRKIKLYVKGLAKISFKWRINSSFPGNSKLKILNFSHKISTSSSGGTENNYRYNCVACDVSLISFYIFHVTFSAMQ